MNGIPKAVFSSTLQRADWHETTIYRDLDALAQLKRQDGAPILAHGGSTFAQALTKHDLIDEYRLNVHPRALGDGYKLFGGPVELERKEARTFKTGTVASTYVRS